METTVKVNKVIPPSDRVDPALMTVIKRACGEIQEQHDGRNYISKFDQAWIGKAIEDAGYKRETSNVKGETEEKLPGGVTDREKAEYLMEKDVWELRRMRQKSNGVPVKSFADMERKARVLLTHFANSIGKSDFSVNPLIQIRALFMDAMFKFGKWER